jgi:hypothetical protein
MTTMTPYERVYCTDAMFVAGIRIGSTDVEAGIQRGAGTASPMPTNPGGSRAPVGAGNQPGEASVATPAGRQRDELL